MVIDVRTEVKFGYEARCGSDGALRSKSEGAGSRTADLAGNRNSRRGDGGKGEEDSCELNKHDECAVENLRFE